MKTCNYPNQNFADILKKPGWDLVQRKDSQKAKKLQITS
jgi:hypothetical protein